MKSNNRTHRLLAMVLALIMVLSMVPSNVIAAGTTIAGSPETVLMGQNADALRENNFNKGWKFYLGDNSSASNQNFDDSSWKAVDLPHDFSITQSFTSSCEAESGFLPGGTGWYRKSFVLDNASAGKTFLLNFDGVYMHAYVYVNGEFVGAHHYGYTAFAFDITDYLVCDGVTENVVAVKAVNNIPSSRWYSGSGIYRDVTLYALDPVHVDLNGVTVTTPNVASGSGYTVASVDVVNDSDASVAATVTASVREKDSTVNAASATQTVTIAAGQTANVELSTTNSAYTKWSLDDPNLWTMHVEVSVGGKVVDSYDTDFGYRWFTFSSTGFALNGENVKLNGVCLHHDQGGLGSAAYYDAMYRQLSIMKEMGCNAIRTSHNPVDEDFIAICNELGLLVIEEIFDGITKSKNGNTYDFASYFTASADSNLYGATDGMICAEYAARSTVKRDRNAPSVFAWSFGNEIQEGNYVNDPGYATYSAAFIEWVNDEDGTRITTMGDNTKASGYSYVNQALTNILNAHGVVGFNYHLGQADTATLLAGYGGDFGTFIASETASHTNSRSRYQSQASNDSIDEAYHLTSYDTSAVSWGATAHDSIYDIYTKDYIAGEFVWTGFDYIGEPTPCNGTSSGSISGSGAIPNSSYFGIVETTGFAKDSYYLYRAQWNKDATTVHLVTAWDSDNYMLSGGKTPVWVYTNAAKVELYLNGSLIGTTERTAHTSNAGHTYYTYSATSNDTAVCSAANNTGADALYTIFNVAYTTGTLTAKAYDESGNEIALDDSCGRYTVSTPGTVTQLKATVNKTEITADGSSLAYVEIDVLDADGNPDTTASNNITFTLSGPGVIAAVDNGDQATTAKYQQPSVLTSTTTANINAYAGKALAIIRSTEDAGEIFLNIASSGLTGQNVKITTIAAAPEVTDGLVSYSMVRDYSIKEGTVPTMDTAATGTLADGSTVTGSIAWDAVSDDMINTAGDYTINGTMTLAGLEPMAVSAKLHVIPNVIDLRNVSTATMENVAPTLPDTVVGVLADGTLAGEFAVVWDKPDASEFDEVGEIVTVSGTAVIFGDETMDVTCTVRVAETVNTESTNVGTTVSTLSQDVPENYQSDNLNSIIDGVVSPPDSESTRWTNWGYRFYSDTATITMTWATAVLLSDINLYYRYDSSCAHPKAVEFSYSLNGTDFITVEATESQITDVSVNYGAAYTYALDEVINPVALKIKFTQQGGTSGGKCVGLYEIECMTYAAAFAYNTSAALSSIAVDSTPVENFSADTLTYEAAGSAVTAETTVNAGITVLPVYEGVVRVLTVSEDGSTAKTYAVTVGDPEPVCEHTNTRIEGAVEATCTTNGYTGDTYCTDCGALVESGTVSTALGHRNTEVRGASAATCEGTGYTGDTWCNDCGTKIDSGTTIAAKGHSWNAGVITKEPTETEAGVKTYTCTACGDTKTEEIAYQNGLKAPAVSMSVSTDSSGRIVITGMVEDYKNLDEYYEITAHGLLYIETSRIGTRILTVNTSGRTRVNFSGYQDDGSFIYNLKPSSKTTSYSFRAFITYTNTETGKSITVYSDMIRCSFNSLG